MDTSAEDVEIESSSSDPNATSSTSPLPTPSGPLCNYGPRLAFTYFKGLPDAEELNAKSETCYFFTIDTALIYLSFYQDWGPLNVAMFYRFSLHLHGLLEDKSILPKKIVLYSSETHDKRANAALLIALYAMVVLRWSVAEAIHPIAHLELRPFRDAGYARADFNLSVQDCLFGIKKAVELRLLRLDEFDVREYEHYEKVENGDWNFVTPHFLAFASPVEPHYNPSSNSTITSFHMSSESKEAEAAISKLPKPFKNVLEQFTTKNVKMVIRLNKKLYNKTWFEQRNIKHIEMFYEDGTNPTMDQCRDFIDISDHIIRNGGVVAVHCKAGLGRTGTLIGAYMIYKWGFTANEAIAFQRFMRPGCVVGPQQHFLYTNQHVWVRWAALDSVNPVARSLPPAMIAASNIVRPETPPSETEVQPNVVQASPGKSHQGPVPGQPRKTPGAKSRHAIALPETSEATEDPAEELMLVQTADTPPEDIRTDEMQIDVAATQEAHQAQIEMEAQSTSTSSQTAMEEDPVEAASPSPTRASSRQQQKSKAPLTVLPVENNAPLAVSMPSSPATPSSVPRSKAVKNLGVYSDQKARPPSPTSATDRYNLRANRSASQNTITTLNSQNSFDAQPASQPQVDAIIVSASPSKLPTRINNKRRNTTKDSTTKPDVFGSVISVASSPAKSTRAASRRRNSIQKA